MFSEMPGDCSPSRRVVSKICTCSMSFSSFSARVRLLLLDGSRLQRPPRIYLPLAGEEKEKQVERGERHAGANLAPGRVLDHPWTARVLGDRPFGLGDLPVGLGDVDVRDDVDHRSRSRAARPGRALAMNARTASARKSHSPKLSAPHGMSDVASSQLLNGAGVHVVMPPVRCRCRRAPRRRRSGERSAAIRPWPGCPRGTARPGSRRGPGRGSRPPAGCAGAR